MYNVDFTLEARIDLAELEKSEPKLFAKVNSFVKELKEHPKTGIGHPEPLKGQPEGGWSRRISKKHRLIYRIFETDVLVLVLSSYGHYDDK